jgi:hypothetical protein
MSRALKFTESAERYANNKKALLHDAESLAHRIINLAERVSLLDSKVVSDDDRESYMTRIWDAYGAVTNHLNSDKPYNLSDPEIPFFGDMLGDMGTYADWDGCLGQVIVDQDYEGWES